MDFFWLHIKKCGGQSFRQSFSPPYIQTKRGKNTKPFLALPKEEWNDALNNSQLPLGEYDYKRMLFASRFLYTENEFDTMFKFVIVRNPYARAISNWKYLTKHSYHPEKIRMRISLKRFLKKLPDLWNDKRFRHIATHTAPIWDDITDEGGALLVDEIFYLEQIDQMLERLNYKLGVNLSSMAHVNITDSLKSYRTYYTGQTKKLVEELYADDIYNLGYAF